LTAASRGFGFRELYKEKASLPSREELPYCAKCQEKPSPPYNLRNVRHDNRSLDFKRMISEELAGQLTAR
jgi:hypothetical protein